MLDKLSAGGMVTAKNIFSLIFFVGNINWFLILSSLGWRVSLIDFDF
jgi:hypothetical protein